MLGKLSPFDRRKRRVRSALRANGKSRPRLSVFRSSKHIYAQLIDDALGRTLAAASSLEKDMKTQLKTGADTAAASSLEKDMKTQLKTGADTAAATAVGKLLAERALKIGVDRVVFDRGGYRYHGRIKALADGARAGGLKL